MPASGLVTALNRLARAARARAIGAPETAGVQAAFRAAFRAVEWVVEWVFIWVLLLR
jgi:hypothetical protein